MEQTYRAIKTEPTTLAIYCPDPKFQFAFNRFFMDDLNLVYGQFIPIVVAGGPGSLANPIMTIERQFLSSQIIFFLRHFPSIKSIILINHEDCGFYGKILNLSGKEKNREKDDAPVAAKAVVNRIALEEINGIEVAAFYAKFANADKKEIAFEKM
ncbi:MAG: hypothetical protein AAB529_00375 [Patescibacteria group bacterium]